MRTLPTDLPSAHAAFDEIKGIVEGLDADVRQVELSDTDTLIVDRQPGEMGAYLLHRDETSAWHMTIWLESGDFQLWADAAGVSRWLAAGNVNTGKLAGTLARKAA